MEIKMKYEIPEMEIIIFSDEDISTNLQASGVGTGADKEQGEDLGFGSGFH